MQLPTLTITRDEAKEEVQRYRRARQHVVLTREDERMLTAYRAIAKGKTVIDLHRAIALAGTRSEIVAVSRWRDGRQRDVEITIDLPVLAVLRADKRWAWTDGVGRDGTMSLRATRDPRPIGEVRFQAVEVFPRDDERGTLSPWRDPTFRALLPTIPPHLRPTRALYGGRVPIDLSKFLVLWEAEWQLDRTVPPGDPALLRHLGGTLYTVEAQWDLTPVEQAVLAGRQPTAKELSWRA
jgi:hypothetical protein